MDRHPLEEYMIASPRFDAIQIPDINGEIQCFYTEARDIIAAKPTEYATRVASHILELLAPNALPLLGMAEVGIVLGVSKQRIYQLRERDDFPATKLVLKATPLWETRQMIEFALRRMATRHAQK